MGRLMWAAAALCCALAASPALADPCKAIPDKGPMPAYLSKGRVFTGPVVYVGDGDSLCIGLGPAHEDWVEVRLRDFYAPEIGEPAGPAAKAALEHITTGREARCVADHRSWDRVVARCTIGGRSVGDLMRAAGVPEGGRGR